MSRRDDPVERHWERQIDRAAEEQVRIEESRLIRGQVETRDAHRRAARAQSALERDTARRQIVEGLDALTQRLADCAWLDDAVRERWMDLIEEIRPDDGNPASVGRLSDDIANVCAALQQDLSEIAEVLAPGMVQRDDLAPPLVAMNRARRDARTRTGAAGTRIAACVHLNAEIRDEWLSQLPDPDESLRWLTSTGRGAAESLRRQVTGLSEAVGRSASRMSDELRVITVVFDGFTAE